MSRADKENRGQLVLTKPQQWLEQPPPLEPPLLQQVSRLPRPHRLPNLWRTASQASQAPQAPMGPMAAKVHRDRRVALVPMGGQDRQVPRVSQGTREALEALVPLALLDWVPQGVLAPPVRLDLRDPQASNCALWTLC